MVMVKGHILWLTHLPAMSQPAGSPMEAKIPGFYIGKFQKRLEQDDYFQIKRIVRF
jgi:hypothetical protein